MARAHAPSVIEITSNGKTTGTRGRIERLYVEYFTKAQALRIAADILDEEDRKTALAAVPKKLIAAVHHRNDTRPPKPKRPKAPIHGPALSLFILEHLDDTEGRPKEFMYEASSRVGSPVSRRGIMATMASVLVRRGLVTTNRAGFRRTSKGATWAIMMRKKLEAAGKIITDGYVAPATR
jgi:hypothetical protein